MDCKIISKLFFLIFCFLPTHSIAIEFTGKFLQGHFIIGQTDPKAKIIIDKKEVKVSEDGFFVFGLDRDRKFDLTITKIINGKKDKIIKLEKLDQLTQIYPFSKINLLCQLKVSLVVFMEVREY